MKKRKLAIILSLLLTFTALLVLTGCTSGTKAVPDDYKGAGYYQVFMYFNGGNGKYDNPYSRIFIDQGGGLPLPERQSSYEMTIPTRPGYDFYGWYQIDNAKFTSREEDRIKEGQPIYDPKDPSKTLKEDVYYIEDYDFLNPDKAEPQLTPASVEASDEIFVQRDADGNIRQWNFDFDRVTDDTTLVALWRLKRQYVLLPPEYKYEDPDSEGFEERTGLKKENCEYDGSILRITRNDTGLISRNGYQIEGFYTDRQYTSVVSFTGAHGRYYPPITEKDYNDNGELKTIPIYINWIEDRYTIVESVGDIPSIMKSGEEVDYYYLNQNGYYYLKTDLNLGGNQLQAPDVFRGAIEGKGKGHTIYNFRVDIIQDYPSASQTHATVNYGGIFNKLDSAKIRNVNFEGITYNFYHRDLSEFTNMTRKEYINVFASEINDYCEIKNVHVGTNNETTAPTYYHSILQNIKSSDDFKPYFIYDDENKTSGRFATADGMILYVPEKYSPPLDGSKNPMLPTLRQLGNNFEFNDAGDSIHSYPIDVVSDCSAAVENRGEWESPYEMEVNEGNYRNLPKYSDESIYKFYGWCDIEGVRIDLTRDWTEDDDGIYYAMWVRSL